MPEAKQEELEEELTPVGEGADQPEPEDEEEPKPGEQAEEEDEDLDEEDDDDGEDERVGASEDEDDDDEVKKERRRNERKSRRQRQREARDRDKRELNFLQQRNEQLERRFSELDQRVGHSEAAQVDARITDVKSKLKLADQVISKAVSSQDGEAMVEAQGIRDELRDNLNRLTYVKQQITTRGEQPQPAAVDERLVTHAQDWMEDHDWWDPNGGDEDSRQVSRIDAQLVAEGLDPTTDKYWDELSKRVETALPHRYANGEDKPKPKKQRKPSGPTFSTGGRERPLRKGEVYISPERRQAMEEAGVWDDPDLRQKYLKQYAKYDAENA
jgi:hypothetical protein